MNKHLETLVGFGKGTKKIFKDQFYELWDAWDELVSAFKKIGTALFTLIVWVFSLVLICILPLATWLRLKTERDYEIAVKKARRDYLDRMTCLHQKGGVDD